MAVELPFGWDPENYGEEGDATPSVPTSPPIQVLPPENLSGFSPEQLSALNFQKLQQAGLLPTYQAPTPWQMVNEPLVSLSRFAPSSREYESATDVLASLIPGLPPEAKEELLLGDPNAEPGTAAKVAAGVHGGLIRGAESLTSPLVLATAGLGTVPGLARGASGLFAAQMLSGVPEASQRLGEATASGDPEQIAAAATDLAVLGAGTVGAGIHGLGLGEGAAPARPAAPPRLELPESIAALEELRQEQPTAGGPSALQVRPPEEILRNVPEQPAGRPGVVPTAEGRGEVPPGDLPPGDRGRAPAPEEAREPDVSLAEERFASAEAAKPEVAKLGTSRFKNPQGDPLSTTYHASPEDWAKWQDVKAGIDRVLKSGGAAAMETPEFQKFFKENERIKNKYGGMPPEPPKPSVVSEATPLDFQKISNVDPEGNRIADPQSLIKQLESGELKAGESGTTLLKHLLEPSEAHPLKRIQIIDMRPEDLQAVTGHPVAYRGRFLLERDTPAGVVEILTRDDAGNPITHEEFVKTINHELTHNAVTSKFDDAPAPVKADLSELFTQAKEKVKGSELEKHNAFSDEHEFLSEAASAKEIQDWMTKQAYAGKGKAKNFWGRFVEIVKGILGSPEKVTTSMLDEAMRISGELETVTRKPKGVPQERFGEERFARAEEDRPKGIAAAARVPGALRGAKAGAVTLAPLVDLTKELPTSLKVVGAQLAGKSAPRTSTASTESGNALIRYASAKIAAPVVSQSMATDVLGTHYKDFDFSKKLGAVLVEDRLRAIQDANQKAGSSNLVNSIIGREGSPFKTEADFQAALADPEVQAAIQRHKQTVQPVAQSAHTELGGQLAGPGLNTGAFVNLKAIFEGDTENLLAGAGRGNLTNPLKRPSRFIKEAKGTAANYEIDYRTIAQRMIEGNFEESAKRKMYAQMVKDGLAVINNPGDPAPTIGGKPAVKFTIERRGLPAGEGRARTYIKNFWVRSDLAPEVRNALNVDGPIVPNALVNIANVINKVQLAGPTDAVWHTASMLGSIAGSQGGRTMLIDLARKLPGVNIADAVTRTVASSIKVLGNSPEIQRQLAELGRIGALREVRRQTGPLGVAHNVITLVDRAGRLVRNDLYQNLVKRGLVRDTEAGRREWVNQMGQYNPRLMGQFQRFFREAGFSPFIVAGRNFNRMAARRITLDPGVQAASPAAAAQMRAVEFLGTAATLFAIPALFNYLLTGSPAGRPGTKMGQIDTGKDDKGKHIVIDPAQWTGLRRGLRISGLQAAIEGARTGQRGKRTATQAIRDIIGGQIHPWAGPAVAAASVAGTGYTPSMYKESENPKDYADNLKAAGEQLNPLLKGVFKSWEESKPGVIPHVRTAAKEVGLSLGGAAGIKAVPAVSAKGQLFNAHERFRAENPDPRIKADFERHEAATFPLSQYRDLDKALVVRDPEATLKAIEKIRPLVKTDKDIIKRMSPVVGTGLKMHPRPLFHESQQLEQQFLDTLNPKQEALYDKAMEQRLEDWDFFLEQWDKRGPEPERGAP